MPQNPDAKTQDETSTSQRMNHSFDTQRIVKRSTIHEHCYLKHDSRLECWPNEFIQPLRLTMHATALEYKRRDIYNQFLRQLNHFQ